MNDERLLRNSPSSFIIHRSSFVMRRSRFLPIFFTVLAMAFVIVLYPRLRRDMREPPKTTTVTATTTATTSSTTPEQSPQETMTMEPVRKKSRATTAPPDVDRSSAETPSSPTPVQSTPKHGPRVAPSANATAPPHQSALSRVLAPIVKALTPSKTPAPAPTTSTPQASSQSQSSTQGQNERDTPNDP